VFAINGKTHRNLAGLTSGGVLLGQDVALDVSSAADLLTELSMDSRVSALFNLADHGVRAIDGGADVDCIACQRPAATTGERGGYSHFLRA